MKPGSLIFTLLADYIASEPAALIISLIVLWSFRRVGKLVYWTGSLLLGLMVQYLCVLIALRLNLPANLPPARLIAVWRYDWIIIGGVIGTTTAWAFAFWLLGLVGKKRA